MNSAVYQIQKISNGKSEDIFLHLDELKKNSIKFSKNKDLESFYEIKLDWEDEIFVKLANQVNAYMGNQIKSISLVKNKKVLTFSHNNPFVLNEIFGIFKSNTFLKNFDAHFRHLKVLGRGTFGKVFLSHSLLDNKKYASKQIILNTFDKKDRSLLAVKNEIQILRKMNHPNIIKLHTVYRDDGKFHLVFDFINGTNLKEYLLKNGNLSMQESFILLETLINIAKYLKEQKIIHRDIKPENIIIKDSKISKENIILVDFGLSEFVSDSYDNLRCGTPGFIAPEILRLKKYNSSLYNEKSDIFGIGITWYYSIFGKIPYKSQNKNKILYDNKACNFQFEENPKYEEIKEVIASFLEVNPEKRFDPSKMKPDFFFDLYSKNDYFDFDEGENNRANTNITLFNTKQFCNKCSFIPFPKALNKAFENDTIDSIMEAEKKLVCLKSPSISLF